MYQKHRTVTDMYCAANTVTLKGDAMVMSLMESESMDVQLLSMTSLKPMAGL